MTTYVDHLGAPPLPSVYRFLMEHFGSGAQAVSLKQPAFVAGSGPTSVVVAEVAQVEAPWPRKISLIKASFGLSVSQLASILQVQRPTIYAWLDGEAPVEPRENSQARIDEVYQVAESWARRSAKPALKLGQRVIINGRDLVWYLEQPQIDGGSVDQILDVLGRIADKDTDHRDGKGTLVANLRARGFAPTPKAGGGRRRTGETG